MDVGDMREQWTLWLAWLDQWLGAIGIDGADYSLFVRGTVPGCTSYAAVGLKYWPAIITALKERVQVMFDPDVHEEDEEDGEAFFMPEEIKTAWVWGE